MKFYLYLILCFTIPDTFAQVNLNNGLIGCYPFSGNANDLSDRHNDGTINGAKLTNDRFGNANSAYEFNGIDDYIEIGAQDLEINEFSYSIWVSPAQLPDIGQAFFLFSVGSDYGDQHILLGNQYTDGRHNSFAHGSYQGVAQNIRCTDNKLPQLNQWYHLVLAKDKDSYHFYVDGQLICSNPINGESAFYGTGFIRAIIGARNNYGQASNVLMDDIHLYNRSLNDEEVKALYLGNNTPSLTVTINADNNEPCSGDAIVLTAQTGSNTATYKWKIDHVLQPSANSKEFIYQLPADNNPYQKTIEVEVSDETPCFPTAPSIAEKVILVKNCTIPSDTTNTNPFPPDTTDSGNIPVEVSNHLLVPSVFTPNDDNLNDTWEIFNQDDYAKLEVWIYSRWGEVIFHSNGYPTPWNGMYKNKIVPSGIYIYKIFSEKKLMKSGPISILY